MSIRWGHAALNPETGLPEDGSPRLARLGTPDETGIAQSPHTLLPHPLTPPRCPSAVLPRVTER
ncbi:MAG TPA: hypothetical protein VFN97_23730 [Actinospica sp.]|nr:hypothetical protein [Actinospica sp.]